MAPPKRPKPRDVTVGTRLDKDMAEMARDRAQKEGRSLSAIIRAFLTLWASEETPPGFPPELPDETERARKRPRKK